MNTVSSAETARLSGEFEFRHTAQVTHARKGALRPYHAVKIATLIVNRGCSLSQWCDFASNQLSASLRDVLHSEVLSVVVLTQTTAHDVDRVASFAAWKPLPLADVVQLQINLFFHQAISPLRLSKLVTHLLNLPQHSRATAVPFTLWQLLGKSPSRLLSFIHCQILTDIRDP